MTFDSVTIPHSVPNYSWGDSQDLEHPSIITGKRKFVTLGDYAEVTVLVYYYKLTESEQAAVDAMLRQEATLSTDLGSALFRCTQIKYGLLDNLTTHKIATMTFKSINYV